MTLLYVLGTPGSGVTALAHDLTSWGYTVIIDPAPLRSRLARAMLEGTSIDKARLDARVAAMFSEILDSPAALPDPGRSIALIDSDGVSIPFASTAASLMNARILLAIRNGLTSVAEMLQDPCGRYRNLAYDSFDQLRLSTTGSTSTIVPRACSLASVFPTAPRATPEDVRWPGLTRVGKVATGWSLIGRYFAHTRDSMDRSSCVMVRMDDHLGVRTDLIREWLNGADDRRLSGIRDAQERGQSVCVDQQSCPRQLDGASTWKNWNAREFADFRNTSEAVMELLGYDVPNTPSPSTAVDDFGAIWNRETASLDWYTWMHESRRESHDAFEQWYQRLATQPTSILEVGCGAGVHYPAYFVGGGKAHSSPTFTGLDVSHSAISLAEMENAGLSDARFVCGDVATIAINQRFELVFSQGTIDNYGDPHAFVKACLDRSTRWVYIVLNRDLAPGYSHSINWSSSDHCYYNNLSSFALNAFLATLPCRTWWWQPVHVAYSGTVEWHLVIEKA